MNQFLGGCLMAVGILIAGASGLCSLVFLGTIGGDLDGLGTVLLVGGVPFLIGVMMIFSGRALLRGDDTDRWR